MTPKYRRVTPLSQEERPPCSLPLPDADLSLGNANWAKGLQAMSDWIWSGNLNPLPFPNNLARYFLQIPGIFEQQLNFSTTLIFDEPSFRNGVQISGFVDRVCRELVISLIAQRRRCWYSMTHHAILGRLTSIKHGLTEQQYTDKYYNLIEYDKHLEFYTRVERAALAFADAFATNPKAYTKGQFEELKAALREENQRRYGDEGLWMARLEAARTEHALSLLNNISPEETSKRSGQASQNVSDKMPKELMDIKTNAQIVELAFLAMQFVALTGMFTGLNIPDEDFLPDVLTEKVPAPVIERINELNKLGLQASVPELIPGSASENPEDLFVDGILFEALLKGGIVVEPPALKGKRIPFTPYEGRDEDGNLRPAFLGMPDRDKGLTVGGIQTGVYGWSFGGYFPGSLPYTLIHHPELARYEAPYSLPLLFNEDEWRNGVQTAGYVSRRIKELLIEKIYRLNRTRYGIEHHTMFFYNTFLDEHGVGREPAPDLTARQREKARSAALKRARMATLYVHDHTNAPEGTFTRLEEELMSWAECIVRTPHEAYKLEEKVRSELEKQNQREIEASLRRMDTSPGIGEEAAMKRLVDHQIAEMAMVIGHMDGLARVLTILQLEAEGGVQTIGGELDAQMNIRPDLNENGQVTFTGYFNNRPPLHLFLREGVGIDDAVFTLNELLVNPGLCKKVKARLKKGEKKIKISASQAEKTGEF